MLCVRSFAPGQNSKQFFNKILTLLGHKMSRLLRLEHKVTDKKFCYLRKVTKTFMYVFESNKNLKKKFRQLFRSI